MAETGAESTLARPWRRITTWEAPPGFNMGLDEALLECEESPPTLRLYTWNPQTLSLGYFQRFADVPAAEHAESVVRRITGGGAIHHANELTFSLTTSANDPLYRGPIADSYRRVHSAVARALGELGVEADLRGKAAVESDREGTGMCFHASTALDLVWDRRKGVGSAQRRRRGRVLHHGSIKLGTTPLEGDIATVGERTGRSQVRELADALERALAETQGMRFAAGVPTPAERALAHERGTRFIDPAFLRRR
ncbi:MAG: lipoate--protein ligase family protein [Planctomycetota bacterium]|nr:lipoate--protein ligase family protein [Planctomycetota bacterium]MDP6990252.1 lipoate--protein ligase family protein [Planctomycetota bacterium]